MEEDNEEGAQRLYHVAKGVTRADAYNTAKSSLPDHQEITLPECGGDWSQVLESLTKLRTRCDRTNKHLVRICKCLQAEQSRDKAGEANVGAAVDAVDRDMNVMLRMFVSSIATASPIRHQSMSGLESASLNLTMRNDSYNDPYNLKTEPQKHFYSTLVRLAAGLFGELVKGFGVVVIDGTKYGALWSHMWGLNPPGEGKEVQQEHLTYLQHQFLRYILL